MQGFNVQIGADVKGFEAGMQKVQQATQRAQQSLTKFPQTSNQATQSLLNLSRVAQDAPYGFIGIANNINPLLESFQRLKESAGSTGGAMGALRGALTGPAGVGLAVGIVSSLLVSFGDKLLGTSVHFSKAELAAGRFEVSLKRLKQEVVDLKAELEFGASIQKLALQFSSLKGGQLSAAQGGVDIKTNAQLVEGLTGKINSLSSANKTLRDTFVSQQEAIAKYTGKVTPLAKLFLQFGDEIPQSLADKLDKSEKAILSQYQKRNEEIKALNQERVRAIIEIGVIPLKGAADIKADVDKITIKPAKIKIDATGSVFEGLAEAVSGLTKTKIGIPETFIKTAIDSIVKSPDFTKLNDVLANNQAKALEQLRDKWASLAQQISSVVAPAFNQFIDSITKGENAFRAFGELIKNVLKNVIAQLLQTAIVAGILSLISGGAAGGGFSFGQAFKRISGFANGGQIMGRQLSVVGERGPELFVPSTSGRIIPNNQLGGITGSAFQTIRITGELRQRGRDMVAVISRENAYQGRNV